MYMIAALLMEKVILRSCVECLSLRLSCPSKLHHIKNGFHTTAALRQKASSSRTSGWKRVRRGLVYGLTGATVSAGALYGIASEPQRRKVRVLIGGVKRFVR